MRKLAWWLAVWVVGQAALAEEMFPRPGWHEAPNPLADEWAVKGGQLTVYAGPYPKSFNYYLDQNVFSAELFGQLYETLLTENPVTLELEPLLAARCTLGDDRKTFTFYLDPRARWSDGQPVTAEDVRWTFDAVMDPRHLTGPHKIGLGRFAPPEVLDERTIRFVANEVHWVNLLVLAGLQVLPKHAWAGQDFNLQNFEFPVVSGPYRLGVIKEGLYANLERRADWWAAGLPRFQHVANFATLRYRFFEEAENAFEAFKKGEIDLCPIYAAHRWANQTSGEKYDRNWIVKQEVVNLNPVGFQGIALNMRRPPLDDPRVRRALAHLFNREKMNATLMFNAYFLHKSYYETLYDDAHPCPNEEFHFDKERARALLAEAGWRADPTTGLLMKDGRPLRLQYLSRGGTDDKFIAIFQEDLKDVGISLSVDKKDWAAWAKDMDHYNYDMTWAAWSGGLYPDPESMWLSSEADRPAGQNITGYKNPAVDELIIAQRAEFDVQKRAGLVRQIDGLVTRDVPYILLWNLNYTRLLWWNKFGMPDAPLGKYGSERAAASYWWYDPDAVADLQHAQALGRALPPRPARSTYSDPEP
ncbi:MAG TPA: extracellular solute-binding protein [Kiritimatiellia bacterium]|nr:ABC transporter substrate-binding protein [Kiritimatiellia bacterium]OQC57599.1 MAG: Oligopeptide-binding protein AppA precursor [Verrucomicrobia bacterium ADurb.Bin018]MBP9572378.1 ABC transporter substrate-binding protein [Kiritimatiellia bacterium]HOE01073.1 extracellular solute-binding protein [Kiritimatiellia bacterium]HOE36356.1 extracellular solute-binding protein [Kiritimatiellia bacterium]